MTILICLLFIALVLQTIQVFACLRGWEKTLQDWKEYSKKDKELYNELWQEHLKLIKLVAELEKDA